MSAVLKNQVELPLQDRRKFKPQNFIHTSLFSEVYVFNDIPMQFKSLWERIEDRGRFDQFFSGLVTLMESFSLEDAHKWNHTETLNNLIFPMLEILGYGDAKSKNNSILENCNLSITNEDGSQIELKPSILFCEDEAGKNYIKNSTKTSSKAELKKYLKLPIQTSYYGSVFDRKSNKYEFKKDEVGKRGDVLTNLGANDQMAEYLKIFNVDWGVFTDGAVWRLYRKEMSVSYSEKYYEFDFNDLYNLYRTSAEHQHDEHSEFFEIAKYMFWFFSYDGLIKGPSVVPFTEKVFQESQKYVANIEEDLKERFVHAMTISCNGYLESAREKNHDLDLKLIAKTSESLIFNLIFIRSCESKRVLPVHQDYIHVSLKALVDKIRHFSYNNEYDASAKIVMNSLKDIFNKIIKDDGHEIYDYVQRLHTMVESGDNGFGITGFVESVFYPEERAFYKKFKIKNKEMIKLVYQLFYNFNDGKNVQIPYNLITPRQLGSVYESFLEFQPVQTKKRMFYVKKQIKGKSYWQWVDETKTSNTQSTHIPSVEKNGIIFSPNNEERKTTGSYYTPEYVVNYVVKSTLEPLLKGRSEEEIFKIKVVDPAMGSAHFLLGSLDYLSKKIASTNSSNSLLEIKRAVLDRCIFGVDINPSAVKLGKMSLWLETAMPGQKLERLDDQFIVGDSLMDSNRAKSPFACVNIFKNKRFDAVVGNPPWVSFLGKFKAEGYTESYVKELCGTYNLDTNRPNLFEAFLKRSFEILKSTKGRVGFVLPDSLSSNKQFIGLRQEILNNYKMEKILYEVDFPGINWDVACYVIEVKKCSEDDVFDVEFYNGPIVNKKFSDVWKNDDQKFIFEKKGGTAFDLLESVSVPLADGGVGESFTGVIVKKGSMTAECNTKKQSKILKGADINYSKKVGCHYFEFIENNIVGGTKDLSKYKSLPMIAIRKTGRILHNIVIRDFCIIEQSLYGIINIQKVEPEALSVYFYSSLARDYYLNKLVSTRNSTPHLKKYDLDRFPVPVNLINRNEKKLANLYRKISSGEFNESLQREIDEIFSVANLGS
jgi:adenine-specific DNA-methyltransferase